MQSSVDSVFRTVYIIIDHFRMHCCSVKTAGQGNSEHRQSLLGYLHILLPYNDKLKASHLAIVWSFMKLFIRFQLIVTCRNPQQSAHFNYFLVSRNQAIKTQRILEKKTQYQLKGIFNWFPQKHLLLVGPLKSRKNWNPWIKIAVDHFITCNLLFLIKSQWKTSKVSKKCQLCG